ncbi:hypothetical protein CFAM422_009029 [Trichoderma lentiforme]|uniref:Uncharacterized protein n=1 Tax=Trichoderma lentiforme TaxID=1567552 RepID=A0A9P4X8U6_9HYPO|nr:hypothetical protein CFAM422_009029 [Trichoderma lentiforme]
MSELQPLLSSTRRRTSTDYTELLPDRHGLAPRFSALSHVHLPARDEHCCPHAVLPEQSLGAVQAMHKAQGPFGLAWPCLSLAPAHGPPCPYCTQRARDLARRQGLQLEAAAFRHISSARR